MKSLIEMDLKDKKKKYPNVPEFAFPKLKVKQNANGLTQAIIKFLSFKGHFATRTSSAGRYLVKDKRWIPGTTRKGYPDIQATVNGRSLHIEVKIGKDKMSEAQLKVKQEIESAGGLYFIAKDFDSFENYYNGTFNH